MYCNFFEDFDISIDFEDVWTVFWAYFGISFLLMILRMIVDMFISFSGTTKSISFLELVSFGFGCGFIGFLTFIIIISCADYFKYKKDTYSLFKFSHFKKWYVLTPEKFVFDSTTPCVYYIHNGDKVTKDKLRDCRWNYTLDITTMYPQGFVDFLCYRFFIRQLYHNLEKNDKLVAKHKGEVQKQKDVIYANNEMMRVMGSIQNDIDKILVDTHQIIVNETVKMEKLNKSI